MRLYEHESKQVFQKMGIKIPKQLGVVQTPDDLLNLELLFPAMIKAAVLVGGRGKAGGVKKVDSLEEAKQITEQLLSLRIKEYPVETVFLEEAVVEKAACYVGVTTNPRTFNNVIVASAAGGVDIEEVARTRPDAIIREELLDNPAELPETIAHDITAKLASELQLDDARQSALKDIIKKVYATFQEFDCKVCEINPVIITETDVIAADAKIVLDDNALYRQSKLLKTLNVVSKRHDVAEPTSHEARAHNSGFPYVDLLPEDTRKDPEKLYVGIVPGGAGYGIFSIDEVANAGNKYFDGRVVPINFMDSGGGPPQDRVAEMFHILMDHPLTDMIITSRFGGISSCDVFIRGLIQAVRERYAAKKRLVLVYGRMVGTDLPVARKFLQQAKKETPEELALMEIIVGNEKIMAEIIHDGIKKGFELKAAAAAKEAAK